MSVLDVCACMARCVRLAAVCARVAAVVVRGCCQSKVRGRWIVIVSLQVEAISYACTCIRICFRDNMSREVGLLRGSAVSKGANAIGAEADADVRQAKETAALGVANI